ncbi:MAG: class I SAM-dependent methyltransferase, partial [Candidatus Aenigmatarchaeota archaeon]
LDPTHVREYSSVNEFVKLFEEKGFEVINVVTRQVTYPLTDLAIRLFIKFGLIKPNVKFYEKHKIINGLRRLQIPIFGYSTIEVLVKKNG